MTRMFGRSPAKEWEIYVPSKRMVSNFFIEREITSSEVVSRTKKHYSSS
jgi:hypothetical protein